MIYSRNLDSKNVFFPNCFLRILFFKKLQKRYIWRLYRVKLLKKKVFLKEIIPTKLDFLISVSLQNAMRCNYFDSNSVGLQKRWFETWPALKTSKNFQLNLILWHVLSFSIRTLTIFKKLAQILTCLKVLAQNLTRFGKLVSKCEAAQKTWLKICSFFKKKLSEWKFARKHESDNFLVFTV